MEERGAVPHTPEALRGYFRLQLGAKRLGTASCSNRTGGLMLAVSLWLSSLRFCCFGEQHVYFLLVNQRTVFVVCDSESCPVPPDPTLIVAAGG